MSTTDAPRGIAASAFIETAEGPVSMHETPGKGFAVMTRLPDGQIGFRQLMKLITTDGVPLVRVMLDSGHSVVTAAGHPFYRVGHEAVAAADLRPGDRLETAFTYPADYAPRDAAGQPALHGTTVARIEPAGEGTVLTGTVRDTHALFVTAGVLCGE